MPLEDVLRKNFSCSGAGNPLWTVYLFLGQAGDGQEAVPPGPPARAYRVSISHRFSRRFSRSRHLSCSIASPPCGRQLIDTFSNNLTNVIPADYMWSRDNSIYTLCHKATPDVEPRRALFLVNPRTNQQQVAEKECF